MPSAGPPPHATLRLAGLRVPVRLGWETAERAEPQLVSVDVELRFAAPPPAARSDDLADTVDYARLAAAIEARCRGGEHRLLEHLASDLHQVARGAAPGCLVGVTVTKAPPLPALDTASFTLADWPASEHA